MKPQSKPTPPSFLSADAKACWLEVCVDYALEPRERRALTLAAQAWDRWQQARKILDKQGLTYDDRFGAPRARPEIAIERDNRIGFLRAMRELGLEAADFEARSTKRK